MVEASQTTPPPLADLPVSKTTHLLAQPHLVYPPATTLVLTEALTIDGTGQVLSLSHKPLTRTNIHTDTYRAGVHSQHSHIGETAVAEKLGHLQ